MTLQSQTVRQASGIFIAYSAQDRTVSKATILREQSLYLQGVIGAASENSIKKSLSYESCGAKADDISKLKFNAFLIYSNQKPKHKVFPNNLSGFEQLSAWISNQQSNQLHVCLDARHQRRARAL